CCTAVRAVLRGAHAACEPPHVAAATRMALYCGHTTPSLRAVAGPTVPAAISRFDFWKAITAATVCGPYSPSILPGSKPAFFKAHWTSLTNVLLIVGS